MGVPPGASPAHLPLTHAGVQTAPCGCFFNPRVFCIQWTTNNLLPPATSMLGHSAMSLVGAALWGPQSCGIPPAWAVPGDPPPQGQLQHFTSFNLQRRVVASVPPVLPPYFPGYKDMERQLAQLSLSDMASPVGQPWAATSPATVLPPTSKPSGTQQVTFHCPRRCYQIAPWSARTGPAASPCLGTLVALAEPFPTATLAHSHCPWSCSPAATASLRPPMQS